MSEYVLEAVGITKRYSAGEDEPAVLRGVGLRVAPGQTLAIVGPSGSGKSTLLNILGLLDTPDRGQLHLGGEDALALTAREKARLRNRLIGFVFQAHHLLPQCTVLENVLVPALVNSRKEERERAAEKARSLLSRVGLAKRMSYHPSQLSGGERQRVAVVRALINKPSVVLADEPTGSLDGETASRLSDLLLAVNEEQGTGLVTVTHSEQLADKMAIRYRLENGVLLT